MRDCLETSRSLLEPCGAPTGPVSSGMPLWQVDPLPLPLPPLRRFADGARSRRLHRVPRRLSPPPRHTDVRCPKTDSSSLAWSAHRHSCCPPCPSVLPLLHGWHCFQENLQALLVDIHEDPQGFTSFVEVGWFGLALTLGRSSGVEASLPWRVLSKASLMLVGTVPYGTVRCARDRWATLAR